MNRIIMLCFICIGILCSSFSYAQDLSSAGEKSIKVSGNIGIDLGFYNSYGIAPRRDKFSYLFAANVSPNILGLNMPLSATYSQQETTFLQPFNQFGISPQYKWIKLHLGYRNLTFSPLTLNGHTFFGAGVEVAPPFKFGPFKYELSAMYGRLRRAVSAVDAIDNGTSTSYQRMGYGGKLNLISHKNAVNFIGFSAFRAWDEEESIEAPLDNKGLKPQENLVIGVNGQYRLFESITIKADVATSAITRDSRSDEVVTNKEPIYFRAFGNWLPQRTSTQYRSAIRSSVEYSYENYKIGGEFNNIESGYTTLGSYFFQNDVREYALTGGASLKENTINISASIGVQHNNINKEQNTKSSRLIGSFSFNHTVSEKLNYNASYSSYNSSLLIQKEELSDSLNVYQVSTNYSVSSNYRFDSKGRTGISLNLSHQIGNARDEYSINEANTKFYNAGANFRTTVTPAEITVNTGFNYTLNNSEMFQTATYGPVLSLGKKLLKKSLGLRYMISYRRSQPSEGEEFAVLNNRFSINYKFWKRHALRLSANLLSKNSASVTAINYSELRGRVGYQIRF
ncbi:MAG: hypothetical protein ACI85O_003347 [Saprospiraceae bacterium]|jgi:hypothetical protein